jgi:hypothetical protein
MRRGAIEGSMMTFVVRLTRDNAGRVTGVVEQVKTELKARVDGLEAVGRAIGEMIAPPGLGRHDAQEEERGLPRKGVVHGIRYR